MASLAKGKVEKMWLSDGIRHHRAAEKKKYVVVCPWHNFEFDLDTGLSPCEPDRLRLATYKASLESGEVEMYVQAEEPLPSTNSRNSETCLRRPSLSASPYEFNKISDY